MSAFGSTAANLGKLRRRALTLGGANALDYGMQFLLPVVLARFLPPQAFGEYRLIWLVIMTVVMVVPLHMPGVLYYYLPRSDAATKRLYIHQTLAYMAFAGALGALAVSGLNPFLPEVMQPLQQYGLMVPLLVLLYATSIPVATLPTIEERVGWQARSTLSLTVLRTVLLAYAAYATADIRVLIWALAGALAIKLAVLLFYVARYHGLGGPWFDATRFRPQFVHAAPLGLAAAFYSLRAQGDQWVAADLFSLASFAAFSVASVLAPIVTLFRQSINFVFLPSMSRLQAADDLRGMVELNSRANIMVALFVLPMLAFAFAFAEELIALVYTSTYIAAAPVLRVYTAGLAVMIVELFSLMVLQREGAYVLRLNLSLLVASVLISWQAAVHFGLAGAALGSVSTVCLESYLTLRRISRSTGIRIGAIQDWAGLVGLLASAGIAAGLAWEIANMLVPSSGAAMRLAVGGTVLVPVYAVLALLFGRTRRNRAPVVMAQP